MTGDGPSSTALHIVKKVVFASDEPGVCALVPRLAAEMSRRYIRHATPAGEWQLRAYGWPWVRALVRLVERVTVPGMTLHVVLRKLRLEEIARRSIAEGYRQLVVLGAGYDTLTQRLAADDELADVTLIEVDHPATQRVKLDVLRLYGLLDSRVEYLPCEIGAQTMASALATLETFSWDRKTLVVAEGLLMYLEPTVVDELLNSVRQVCGDDARIAFTFMETESGGRIAFRGQTALVDHWLRWRGEPFRWGIRKESMGSFLAERGYELLELTDREAFRQSYLIPRGLGHLALADGDHLCVAQCHAKADGRPVPVEVPLHERPAPAYGEPSWQR